MVIGRWRPGQRPIRGDGTASEDKNEFPYCTTGSEFDESFGILAAVLKSRPLTAADDNRNRCWPTFIFERGGACEPAAPRPAAGPRPAADRAGLVIGIADYFGPAGNLPAGTNFLNVR